MVAYNPVLHTYARCGDTCYARATTPNSPSRPLAYAPPAYRERQKKSPVNQRFLKNEKKGGWGGIRGISDDFYDPPHFFRKKKFLGKIRFL